MMSNLIYNVYQGDLNTRSIKVRNIFTHTSFWEMLVDAKKTSVREHLLYQDEFAEKVKNALMYCFWSKCEYEVVITGWPPKENFWKDEKIDIYSQVMNNWDIFFKYLLDNIDKIK